MRDETSHFPLNLSVELNNQTKHDSTLKFNRFDFSMSLELTCKLGFFIVALVYMLLIWAAGSHTFKSNRATQKQEGLGV